MGAIANGNYDGGRAEKVDKMTSEEKGKERTRVVYEDWLLWAEGRREEIRREALGDDGWMIGMLAFVQFCAISAGRLEIWIVRHILQA